MMVWATGRRTEILLEDLTNATSKLNRWTYLRNDQWTETNELNQVLAVTLNGDSIDDVLSMTLKGSSQAAPGIALDPVKGHLGSVHAWINVENGAVAQKQSYTAYGETTVSNASPLFDQLGSLRGFTGRELDVDTKLYYYRARYYDSSCGCFLSPDPIGFAGLDTNFYRYVENNPIVFTDAYGQSKETIIAIGGAILIGYVFFEYVFPELIKPAFPAEPDPKYPKNPGPSCNPALQSCQPRQNSCPM